MGTTRTKSFYGAAYQMRPFAFSRNTASFVCSSLLLVLLAGCVPHRPIREAAQVCYPYDLKVEADNQQMTVVWKIKCNRLMSGYNIYISEQPMTDKYPGSELPASLKPFNPTPFPGDTNPDDGIEHFLAEGLKNGVKYYVSVRVVNPDRTLSKPSNEVVTVCGPRGEMELSIRFKSDHDGFSFKKNTYIRADNIDNDMYFYSKDGTDYLASPNRLDGFLKANRFGILPFKGDFDQVKIKLLNLDDKPTKDRVAVSQGDWVHILTSDDKHVLVNVLDTTGKDEHRSLRLFYAFSPLAHEAIF